MGKRSDVDLDADLARLADGDRSAFSPVFATLWPVISRFCERALGSTADGEDAAQVTMQKLFSQVSRYDRSRPAVAWALAIAAWECKTIRRKATRARTVPLPDVDVLTSADHSPEQAVVNRDLEAAVSAALEQLPSADQQTLRLVVAGINADQASRATFRKRKQRALARLRGVWKRMYDS
jgi:RNA polymerase sigma-70 factor (ECF subfamily)